MLIMTIAIPRNLVRAEPRVFSAQIRDKVEKVFGYLPEGFFVNGDPRGYALKLETGSVPYRLHEDWGRYQILAPEIN